MTRSNKKFKKDLPSKEKAKKMLRDGTAHGKPLTKKQKAFLGWVAGGAKAENGLVNDGEPKKLKEVTISGLSPREQAYRDSLALYNIFHRLDSIQSELLYGSRKNINNTVLTNSLGTFSLNDAKEDLEKLQKLARDYYHIKYPGVTVNKDEYYNIPPTEKPVYDPVPIRMPSRSAKINIPQQQRSIQKVKNGFTSDLPGYPTIKVQYSQDGKPMFFVNQTGARIPYEPVPTRSFTKEFAYPELEGGGKNKKKIYIKPSKRGSFTKWCGGKVTGECIARGLKSKDKRIKMKAVFAKNSRGWDHKKS